MVDSNENHNGVTTDVASIDEPEKSRSRKISLKKKISLPNRGLVQINENDNDDILMKFERSKSLDPTQQKMFDDFDSRRFRQRISSIMSLGDLGGLLTHLDIYAEYFGVQFVNSVFFFFF